jgi:hypothetical protein
MNFQEIIFLPDIGNRRVALYTLRALYTFCASRKTYLDGIIYRRYFFLSCHIPTYEAESWMKAAEKVTCELANKGIDIWFGK